MPNFDYEPGYTAFQYVFVFLQSAAFGGVFTGFAIARDFEGGFARRLLLAAPNRAGIIAGYAVERSGPLAVHGVGRHGRRADRRHGRARPRRRPGRRWSLLGMLVNACAVLWACGVAMRLRTAQAGSLIQMPVFIALFLAPVYVPVDLLHGWLQSVAEVNPVTPVLEVGPQPAGRDRRRTSRWRSGSWRRESP